jgi:hypothetical protein
MSGPSWRLLLPLCLTLLGLGRPAQACSCLEKWPSITEAMRNVPLALVARVSSVGRPDDPTVGDPLDAPFVDVDVIEVIKGKEPRSRLRIWDGHFRTSCTAGLSGLEAGTLLALALSPASRMPAEYLRLVKISPAPSEYMLASCGEYWRRFEASADIAAFAADARQQLSRRKRVP